MQRASVKPTWANPMGISTSRSLSCGAAVPGHWYRCNSPSKIHNSKAFIYNDLKTGRPARVGLVSNTATPTVQEGTLLHPRKGHISVLIRSGALFKGQFRHRLTIFPGVRSPVIHSRGGISHDGLPTAHAAGKCSFPFDLVSFARQLIP